MKAHNWGENHPYRIAYENGTLPKDSIEYKKLQNYCMDCDDSKVEVRNRNPMWGDGDVHCSNCGQYIRMWNSG